MYELLKDHKTTIKKLTKAGVIDPHWIRDVEMYEAFEAIEGEGAMSRYSIIADQFGVSEESARKRIKAMRG